MEVPLWEAKYDQRNVSKHTLGSMVETKEYALQPVSLLTCQVVPSSALCNSACSACESKIKTDSYPDS